MNGESDKANQLDRLPREEIIEKVVEAQLKQIELQQQELAFRKEELDFQKQQSAQGFEYSNRVLDANVDDLKTVRTQEATRGTRQTIVFVVFMLLCFGLIFCLIYLNKEAVLYAILEKFAYVIGGGGAVLVYKQMRKKKEEIGLEEDDPE